MSISTDDVNFLVWQYFKDSGFPHTAFVFGTESVVDSTNIPQNQIPPNTLVTILENAHKYMTLERQVNVAREDPEHPLHSIIDELENTFPDPAPANTTESDENISRSEPTLLSPAVASILAGHHLEVYCSTWSPDSHYLATASADTTVMIWDLAAGTHKTIGKPTEENDSGREITALDWSAHNCIASGSFDSKVRLYSPDGATVATFAGHSHHVFAVKFNPAGTYLLSASADHTVIVWDVERQVQVVCFNHHKDTILDIAWKDNSTFACASADNTASICDVQGSFRILHGHSDHVNSVAFSSLFPKQKSDPIGQNLQTLQNPNTPAPQNLQNPNSQNSEPTQSSPNLNPPNSQNSANPQNAQNSPNAQNPESPQPQTQSTEAPAVQNGNPPAQISGTMQKLLTNPIDTANQNAPIALLATGSDDKKVMIWEGANDGYVLEGHNSKVTGVAFCPKDPMLLASVGIDGEVILWDLKNRCKLRNIGEQTDTVMSLCFSPDGEYLATGGDEAKIEVTRVSDGEVVAHLSGTSPIYDLKWDSLGEKLAASFADSTVAIITMMRYLHL